MTARAPLLLVLTLLGLGATSASTWTHYRLLADPGFVSACDINAAVSCTDAYRSAYGTLLGVPVALLGAAFFAFLLLMQIGSRTVRVPDPGHVPTYLFALSLPALAFSAYLASASWFVLKVVCLLCLATYVAVAGLFLVSGLSTRFAMPMLPERLTRDLRTLASRPAALVVALAFLVVTAGLLGWFPSAADESVLASSAADASDFEAPPAEPMPLPQASQLESYMESAPRRMIPVDAEGAAVVVVKFNDYQCPPCGQTYQMYKPLKAKWDQQAPGKVKFVTKDFPLEGECNPSAPQGSHRLACEAAAAVRMARRNNKAEALEDWLFANQATLTAESLRKAVRDIGGVTDFDARYPSVLNEVKVDTSLGGFLGVNATPTFFVNGVQMPDARPQVMDAAIAYELQRAQKRQ